jgi:hypothetical protein
LRAVRAALAVFLLVFAIYVLTAPIYLRAYEPETAAVTDGLVQTGEFRILQDSPMGVAGGVTGTPGTDGKMLGRVGLPQPLAEVPFYMAGWAADTATDSDYRYRRRAMLFFNGFILALVAGLVALICQEIGAWRRWAIAVALLFAFASLAWPYSKIGIEAVVTFGVALALYAALLCRRLTAVWPWVLAGFAAGLAVAAKQYELVTLATADPRVARLAGRPLETARSDGCGCGSVCQLDGRNALLQLGTHRVDPQNR